MLRENICIAQAKVAGKIDRFHLGRQLRGDIHRLSMWQCKKSAVYIAQTLNMFARFDKFQLSGAQQVLMKIANGFAGVLVRGDECDLSVRMLQQNAQQFRSAITRATEDCDLDFHSSYLECAGRAQRRRRFGSKSDKSFVSTES